MSFQDDQLAKVLLAPAGEDVPGEPFAVGTVVELRAPVPQMTVVKAYPESGLVRVAWIDESGIPHDGVIAVTMLKDGVTAHA